MIGKFKQLWIVEHLTGSFNTMFSLGPHPSFVLSAKDEVEREKVTIKKNMNTREEDPAKVRK